ncbi:MAG: hypothetical protein AAGC46_02650 [Solirubrobacteraceae bacterium]
MTKKTTASKLVLVTVAASALFATPAFAAPFDVKSGTLTWQVPYETSPRTLAGYTTTIGVSGGANGGVAATAPATGAPITTSSTPAAGAGVTYAYDFPTTTSGAAGTYDPVAKTGSISFAGTLTFTAHSSTFLSVINPTLTFDAPQSIRVVANGIVPASASDTTPTPYGTGPARQTVFALNASAAVTTANQDGSYTISDLIPSGTPQGAPTSFISSNTVFDGIRSLFGTDRANQGFSVTFAPEAQTPTPTPTPTPAPHPAPPPAATPTPPPGAAPAPAPAPGVTPTPTPTTSLVTVTLKKQAFSKLTVSVGIRKRGTGTAIFGTGTVKGSTLTVRVPAGTTLSGDYVLSRTSGSKKLAKSAVVTVSTTSEKASKATKKSSK